MLALYLLTQPPYARWESILKANLEQIWHPAGPLCLRISIICLRHEQCVIKIQHSIDHLAFFLLLSSLEQLLSAKAFVCFSVVFSPTPVLEQYCHFLSRLLFQKWNLACSSKRTCNEKESLPHMTPLQLHGRDKACSLFWWLKRGWHMASSLFE